MIYFVQENEPGRNRVKIGYTSKDDVTQRLKELQTSSPSKLRVLAVVEGDATKEAYLHRLFGQSRIIGEWFEYDSAIAGFIRYFATTGLPSPDDGGGQTIATITALIHQGARLEKNSNGFSRLRWQVKDRNGRPIMNENGRHARKSVYVPAELLPEVEQVYRNMKDNLVTEMQP